MDRYRGQRRRSPESCDLVARVELSSRLAIACHIKSWSELDCTLGITDLVDIPSEFDLLVPLGEGSFQRHRVRVIWRRGSRLKGLFVGPGRRDEPRLREPIAFDKRKRRPMRATLGRVGRCAGRRRAVGERCPGADMEIIERPTLAIVA